VQGEHSQGNPTEKKGVNYKENKNSKRNKTRGGRVPTMAGKKKNQKLVQERETGVAPQNNEKTGSKTGGARRRGGTT